MLAAIFILLLTLAIIFYISMQEPHTEEDDDDDLSKTPQMKKLWSLAQSAMRERKPLKAEKVLLTILKFDEKNAAAYNRLGILYAREKHFKEAIECFEIAQSLDNNASSLHNVGLIYLETGKYEKAEMAFAQAIELEGDQPGRYIAHAKALEKLGQRNKAIEQLETAYSLNPTTVVLRHMLELYENNNDTENIEYTKRRIEELQAERDAKAEEEKKKANRAAAAAAAKREAKREARAAAKTARKDARAARQDARAARVAAKNARIAARRDAKAKPVAKTPAKPAAKAAKSSDKLDKKKKII